MSAKDQIIATARKYECADLRIVKLDRHSKSGSREKLRAFAAALDKQIADHNAPDIVLIAFTVPNRR